MPGASGCRCEHGACQTQYGGTCDAHARDAPAADLGTADPDGAYLVVVRWWTGSTSPLADALVFYGAPVLLMGYGYFALFNAGRRGLDRYRAIGTASAGR